jgi:hypothetical protein
MCSRVGDMDRRNVYVLVEVPALAVLGEVCGRGMMSSRWWWWCAVETGNVG